MKAQGTVECNDFRLCGAVADALLTFGIEDHRKQRGRAAELHSDTGSAALRLRTSGEIGVCEDMRLDRSRFTGVPRPKTQAQTAFYTREQAEEALSCSTYHFCRCEASEITGRSRPGRAKRAAYKIFISTRGATCA